MLKEQTTRLVNSLFRVTIEGENSRARKNILIADSSFEFWETHNGGWETHLNLNKKFLEYRTSTTLSGLASINLAGFYCPLSWVFSASFLR
ncbi:hypothetical protein RP300_01357 [Oligella urethralis]|nr:hypothetical protein RP300_01357 [Oligella urethralis]